MIARCTGRDLHRRAYAMIETVDQPELDRRQMQEADEVNRQDAHDHLR